MKTHTAEVVLGAFAVVLALSLVITRISKAVKKKKRKTRQMILVRMFKKLYKIGKLRAWSIFQDKRRAEHKLSYLFWECTLRCNLNCKHCGSSTGRGFQPEGELSTEEIKKTFTRISQKLDTKSMAVAVTGGEPLVRKDIFEVMSYVSQLGFEWGMVTNGYLVTEEVVRKMKESGMKTVSISIDGIGDVHDELRGTKGSYEKALNAVRLLKKEDFLEVIQITSTVNKQNIAGLEEMYEIFKDSGAHSWRVMNVDPIGKAEGSSELLLDDAELKELLTFIKEKRKENKKFDVVYGCAGFLGTEFEGEVRDYYFFCNSGISVGSILHNGDIFVCPNVPRKKELIQGNVRQDDFVSVWEEEFKFFRDKNKFKCDKCENCNYWNECLGNSLHTWDFENKEPKMCHYHILNKK